MAELLVKYPDRFVAAIACLPMNNIDAALKEADRAINDLRFRGVMLSTTINDKPLDSPEYLSVIMLTVDTSPKPPNACRNCSSVVSNDRLPT